ncbi:uncharacterized protein BYT42DRAFT_567468 [Radiomyces spectabilis]|uniref:uncharacterized protein n=1 Tax=Radiomyces spectabilis TaxID=64574 RepID=UPI00221EC115|nr:uncharacterized protein BYT42DRAFT_567468 [Radiomyces spectabilis]KAI8379099.1 hypothetical protein BYT42DRAFT_567468 [Radiomyces spectabilis]
MDIQSLLCPPLSDSIQHKQESLMDQTHYMNKDPYPLECIPPWSTAALTPTPSNGSSPSSVGTYFSAPSSPSLDASPSISPCLLRPVSMPHLPMYPHAMTTGIKTTTPSSPSFSSSSSYTDKWTRASTQTRTPWTPEEDFLLQQGYAQGLSWAMISTTYLPHRSRGCCWGRFKTLQAKAMEHREWSNTEDKLLLLAVKKHSKLFRHAWQSVAQDMGERAWRDCEIRSAKVSHMIRKRQYHARHSF